MKTRHWIGLLVFSFVLGTGTLAGQAFVHFEGIDGEAMESSHRNWSEIQAFHQVIRKPSSGMTGSTRRRGDVIFDDLSITKFLDKSSPKLAEALCKGRVFPKVEIHMLAPPPSTTVMYGYELKNALITNYTIEGNVENGGERPRENLTIAFEEITVRYFEIDPRTGRPLGYIEYTWKVEEGER